MLSLKAEWSRERDRYLKNGEKESLKALQQERLRSFSRNGNKDTKKR